MSIEIADDNHIGTECTPVNKRELAAIKRGWLIWETITDWYGAVQSGSYQDHDCDGVYGCVHDGILYTSNVVSYTDDAEDKSKIPTWATHVLWSAK